jgi:hypothetical protein
MMTWILAGALAATALPAPADAPPSNSPATVAAPAAATVAFLARLAPHANPEVLALALEAMRCAKAGGVSMAADRLAVIDYSRPSLEPRLWVFDLSGPRLLFEELVAHGRGSGENEPTNFSNADGSHASSLGLFVTGDTYLGRNGYSLRMDGLEPGFNDRARERAIVRHGAPYVDAVSGGREGRIGRSWGCPAVREAVARRMIDVLKGGQFLFAYYPDSGWLRRSALLGCAAG